MAIQTNKTTAPKSVTPADSEAEVTGIAVPNSEDKTPADGQAYNEAVLKDQKIRDLELQLFAAQRAALEADTTKLTAGGGTKVSVPTDQAAGLKSFGFK